MSTNPGLYLALLLTLGAFFNSLDRASGRSMGDRAPMWLLIGLSLLFAPLAVPLSTLVAMFGRWVGEKLGGVATREEVRAAVAWSAVPAIAGGIVFWPIHLVMFGEEMFTTETPLMDASNPFIVLAVLLLPIIPAIWALIVGLKVYAEVHRFSAWRSLGAGLLAMAIIVVPVLALAATVAILT